MQACVNATIDRAKIAVLTSNLRFAPWRAAGANSTSNEQVITGYNTDVEHDGVVYHVQTEDKGFDRPIILSLVYTGGEILASKRSPYEDLIASGFDEKVLAERVHRQHQLMCAAIHAGRIEDLKNLTRREQEKLASYLEGESAEETVQEPPLSPPAADDLAAGTDRFSISNSEQSADELQIILLDEKPLRSGESVTLRILLTKRTDSGRVPAAKGNITLKILGSTFQPASTYSTTDSAGRAAVSITLPSFETGRAAVLIRAEADGEVAELRRVIQPS